jgi:transposase
MIGEDSSRRIEFSLNCTSFLGHLGLIVRVLRELEVDKLINERLPKERDKNVPYSVCILAMVLRACLKIELNYTIGVNAVFKIDAYA